MRQIEPVINETPPEVLDIEVAVAVLVHGLKDASDVFDAITVEGQDFGSEFLDQILEVKSVKLLDRGSKAGAGSSQGRKNVLVQLELGRDVHCDVSSLLQCQVLCFVEHAEVVRHDLKLITKVCLINIAVRSQECQGLAVLDEEVVAGSHGLALHFKSDVGINSFNDPGRIIAILCIHADLLIARNRRVQRRTLDGR